MKDVNRTLFSVLNYLKTGQHGGGTGITSIRNAINI